MNRDARRNALRELIAEARFSRQDELVTGLRNRGFDATQASVSRDLDELGIIKHAGFYTVPTTEFDRTPLGRVSIAPAGDTLIVLKCRSGLASAAAVKIDAERIDDIVGTIAGDDTIFIAVSDAKAQKRVIATLSEIFSVEAGL